MDGLNQVTLIGSVGKDAEVTFIKESSKVAKFSLATNRSYKDKDGNKQTKTEWHNIEVWNEKANFAGNFVKKGQLVCIVGEIRYEKFEDKEGRAQQRTKIVAETIQLFPKGGNGSTTPAAGAEKPDAVKQTEEYAKQNSTEFVGNTVDDDLPF